MILYHGTNVEFDHIDLTRSKPNKDFGQGFYTGESYDQAISFVSGFDRSSVYYLDFDETSLKCNGRMGSME